MNNLWVTEDHSETLISWTCIKTARVNRYHSRRTVWGSADHPEAIPTRRHAKQGQQCPGPTISNRWEPTPDAASSRRRQAVLLRIQTDEEEPTEEVQMEAEVLRLDYLVPSCEQSTRGFRLLNINRDMGQRPPSFWNLRSGGTKAPINRRKMRKDPSIWMFWIGFQVFNNRFCFCWHKTCSYSFVSWSVFRTHSCNGFTSPLCEGIKKIRTIEYLSLALAVKTKKKKSFSCCVHQSPPLLCSTLQYLSFIQTS